MHCALGACTSKVSVSLRQLLNPRRHSALEPQGMGESKNLSKLLSPTIGCPDTQGCRLTGSGLRPHSPTYFKSYVDTFATRFDCEITGIDRPMQAASNDQGVSIINFGMALPMRRQSWIC